MYTSGFIADSTHRVVLFFSGRAHAGENFDKIMIHRDEDKACVNRMADALAANSKHKAPVNETKCNAHAFRRFRSLIGSYNNESKFVMGIYDQVYEHDTYCKKHHHTDKQRLAYHQEHSLPLMNKLRDWAKEQLNESAEPNSVLAAECKYLLNHWPGLTKFLELAGAPLDNNALEAMLKMMIMYRKNSQIFKTAYSAEYGSRLISIIATCRVNSSNSIDYLTQIQKHEPAVWANPEAWMPWSYQQTLQNMTNPI
jgi:transposase